MGEILQINNEDKINKDTRTQMETLVCIQSCSLRFDQKALDCYLAFRSHYNRVLFLI